MRISASRLVVRSALRRRIAFPLALLLALAAALQTPIARESWSSFLGAQWHLDIESALDAARLAPGMIVGEAGAGDGFFTLPMATRVGTAGVVYANDISSRALRTLEERAVRAGLANIRTVMGDVADPRFPRRDLHLIVVVHALHDFSRPVEWLVNAKDYLRPGGAIAIIDRDPEQGGGSHFWARSRIERYAADAGYTLARAEDVDSRHLVLVFTPTVG